MEGKILLNYDQILSNDQVNIDKLNEFQNVFDNLFKDV
jgi:hypothetical protein